MEIQALNYSLGIQLAGLFVTRSLVLVLRAQAHSYACLFYKSMDTLQGIFEAPYYAHI